MWIVFCIFLVLWIVGVDYYLPPALIITFFAGMVGSAAVALMPSPAPAPETEEVDIVEN